VTPTPSRSEAAAIAAAIERFLAETAPAPAAAQGFGGWQRAALLEGIGSGRAAPSPWGEPRGWGAG